MVPRKKFLYLPEAVNASFTIFPSDGPVSAPEPQEPAPPQPPEEPAGIYPCPCCGFLTFPVPKEAAIAYVCPVCLWENDVFDPGEDDPSDENHGMTLREGRENDRKWGAVREDLAGCTRPPRPEELP